MSRSETSARATRDPWWAGEDMVRLSALPKLLPPQADGRPVTRSTVYRWTVGGVHGIRLRRLLTGGRGYCTTKQELARFLVAITAAVGEAAR